MKGMRQNWLESKLAAAEAEVNKLAALEFDARVPPECTAVFAGAAAGALEAIETIPALDKLWGMRGDERKAMGVVRVFALHLVSTWLANAPELPSPADSAIARKDWAAHVLRIFGMESEQNLNQFQMRDVQTSFDHQAKGQHLVSVYLLLSDLMRALGDDTKGPLVQAKTVPLGRFDDLVISPAFRDRVSSIDITTIKDISMRSRQTCSEVYEEHGGASAPVPAAFSPTDAATAGAVSDEEEAAAAEDEAIADEAIIGEDAPEVAAEVSSEPTVAEADAVDASVLNAAAEALPAAAAVSSATEVAVEAEAPAVPAAAAAVSNGFVAAEQESAQPAEAGPDAEYFEFEGGLQDLRFAPDGVGIVSIYDEAVPVWRELGFARGSLQAPREYPLRIAVNLSLKTAVAAMEENTRRQFERMDDAQLNRAAAAALVPMEHQFLRPLACPRCGNHEHLNLLQQEAVPGEYHPDISAWPFSAPGGDRYTLGCPACDFLFEVVFWFYE